MAENLEICPTHSFPNTATLSSLASDRFKSSRGYPKQKKKKKVKYVMSKINMKKPFMLYPPFPAFQSLPKSCTRSNLPCNTVHLRKIMVFRKRRITC